MSNDYFRNRALLDLAYTVDCTLRIDGICVGGPGEPAHSNQSRHGKGGMIKAHDCFFASACRPCHRELDQGKRFDRATKADIWQRGHDETMLTLWKQGSIGVIG